MAWEKLGSTKLEDGTSETTTTAGAVDSNAAVDYGTYKQITGLTAGDGITKVILYIYNASTNIKVAIFSDSSNEPSALLGGVTTKAVSISNTNTAEEFTLDTTAYVPGDGKIWVCMYPEAEISLQKTTSGSSVYSNSRYQGSGSSYSAAFPTTMWGSTGQGSYNVKFGVVTVSGGGADTITVEDLTAKKNLMVQVKTFTVGGNIKPAMRFNNDSGSNYATRDSQDGGTDATETSVAEIRLSQDGHGGTVGVFAFTINVINDASNEKIVTADTIRSNATGAGTAPARYEIASKWANTSNAITRVDIINEGTGDFATGSEVAVYGTD